MKFKPKPTTILAVLAVVALPLVWWSQCSAVLTTSANLSFVPAIEGHTVGGPYEGADAKIRVVTDAGSVTGVRDWLFPYDADTLSGVDYGRYFAIVVFNGWRASLGGKFSITKIKQDKTTIYVEAVFDDGGGTGLPATSSQYEAAFIERTSHALTGLITFKLIDANGKERSSVTQYL